MIKNSKPNLVLAGLLCMLLLSTGSCERRNNIRMESRALISEGLLAYATITRYNYKQGLGKDFTDVYGTISFHNTTPTNHTIDLDGLCLKASHAFSSGANIDSIADYIPRIAVDAGKFVEVDVVWVLDGKIPLTEVSDIQVITQCKQP